MLAIITLHHGGELRRNIIFGTTRSNYSGEDHPLTCAVTKGLKSDSAVLLVPRIPGKENLVQGRKPDYNER